MFLVDIHFDLFNIFVYEQPPEHNGTFLQQLECGYGFPALIHVWIASAGVLEALVALPLVLINQH